MGRDKAALPCPALPRTDLPTETFFSVATERLSRICRQVAVSGHCSVNHLYQIVEDEVGQQGPMLGVLASLQFAADKGFGACVITPIDTPFLAPSDLQLLVKAWTDQPGMVVAFSDRKEPLIAIYPTTVIDELQQCVEKRQLSLMRWLNSIDARCVEISVASCRNINHPDDYETKPPI